MKFNGKKIIIFDDDEDILSVCTYVLEEQGWDVTVFTDCNQIIEKVSNIMPDVILMDNWIPDEGGVKATRQIKNDFTLRSIPVIFFSANDRVQELAAEAGAEFYLQKPFEIEELDTALSKAIAIYNETAIRESSHSHPS